MATSTDFTLLPAIDLRGGRLVRLVRGDFTRETDYGDDPVAVALGYAGAGATAIHVVDLDGARQGKPVQIEMIGRLAAAVGAQLRCEVAGGLRTEDAVTRALDSGAWRAVIGTAAIRDPRLVERLVRRHGPDRIAIALDVRGGVAVGEAWQPGAAGRPVEALLDDLADAGATTFEVTAIERDGLLGGPDVDLLARLVARGRGGIIASGGVAGLDDLRTVRAIGCTGAIVGRAIYEGRIDLAQAIRVARDGPGR